MAILQKAVSKNWPLLGHCSGRGNRGQDHFLQLGQHVSTISINAPPHRWPTSGQIPIIAGRQCRSPQIHSQASVSLLARLQPLPLLLAARLLLPQFLLLFLLFLLNPRPPGAERLVGTREAFRITIIVPNWNDIFLHITMTLVLDFLCFVVRDQFSANLTCIRAFTNARTH